MDHRVVTSPGVVHISRLASRLRRSAREGTLITSTLLTPRLAPAALGSVKLCKNWWKYAIIPTFQRFLKLTGKRRNDKTPLTFQPSHLPTSFLPFHTSSLPFQSSNLPTFQPSNLPTFQPSNLPAFQHSNLPTCQPSNLT